MQVPLSQRQRLLTAGVYLSLLWVLFNWILTNVSGAETHALFWSASGALMIVLGAYVVEPYFTTPADAIVNGLALLIALSSLSGSDRQELLGSAQMRYYAYAVIAFAVAAIFLKDTRFHAASIAARVLYTLAEWFGKSTVIFSIAYLSASYSFFARAGELGLFIAAITFWICVTFFDVAGNTIGHVARVIRWLRSGRGNELGTAIGHENPLQYKVEVDYARYKGREPLYGDLVAIETKTNVGSIGMVVDRKQLLGKIWLSVYVLTSPTGDVISLDLREKKLMNEPRSVFAAENKVFLIDLGADLDEEGRGRVQGNPLYAYKHSFVGYVTMSSNISTINFVMLRDRDAIGREIAEGAILKTTIYGEETLYQVINGNTREEHLEAFDRHGYTVGIARKLGKYNHDAHELETIKWMPIIYAPLFFGFDGAVSAARISAIAQLAIGRLPETDLEIRIKDIHALVTHNTAILGILGIGKSCLAYEIIRRVTAEHIKVVAIDITNEYQSELPGYLAAASIVADNENAFNGINAKFEYVHNEGQKQVPDKSGNISDYKAAIRKDLCQFLFGVDSVPQPFQFETTKAVRIYNVDYHKVSKGEKIGFNVLTIELTQAEKTRIIAEELFKILMKSPLEDIKKAKVLLAFEEAHSLIPEWNSVASEGDKNATNGTAKVILQGRKYGLGSLVVTQRTANVSKSILNQCNTIFALRVFDDTGKGFLENYIGEDYADTLATLEERHAIAIGKGLRLKQPVIIQLNDRSEFMTPATSPAADGVV
jgi:hypothetical protein